MEQVETVSAEFAAEEKALREQLEQSEQALAGLRRELDAADAQLEELAQEKPAYDALSQACKSLEELQNLGAGHLFWEEHGGGRDPAAHIDKARGRLEQFVERVVRTEDLRRSIAGQMGEHSTALDVLHYDLHDALQREESRRNEWLVEREAHELPYRAQIMPWARGCEEDERFRKSLASSVVAACLLGILVSLIDIPIPERAAVIEVPERVAKLVRKELAPPPPPVPVEEPEIPDEIPEPELAREEPKETVPEAAEEPVVAQAPKPDTKEQVKSKGILAFRDSFAARANLRPSAQLGSQARVTNAGADAVGRPERSMVTTSAPGSSGGINLASISRDVGGGGGGDGIGGVALTRVASSIGGGGGDGDRPLSGGGALAGRTDEEIQIVFDRYKAALYRLYNRELRKDPTLRGQLVLRLTIEPDGTVSMCQLQSSDMHAPVLSQQVVDRVGTFDFGAKEGISAITIIYPIDFLPAA